VLRNPGVAGGVNLTVFPVTGSDPSDIALNKASGASLNEFVKVSNRDEKLPAMNKAGAMVAQVWRSGTGAKGDLFTCDAICQSGDAYFLMSYGTANAAQWKAEQRLIQALLDRISIEPAP
jgi:hypothetical protein